MPSNTNKDITGFSPQKLTIPPKGKNYLFVIGIDAYAHCPKLHNAVKDAKEIVAILKKRFEFDTSNVQELYDQNATKSNIYKAFRALAQKVTPTDNVVIYFSGHGEYDKLFNIGYWIPIEAEKAAVDQYIPNSEIKNILSAIKSHHTFLMVDSCFSGALFAKGTSRNVALRKERDPSRWGLTAGRNEIVTDGKKGTNSPFAKSILYQLNNTDKPLGVAELCDKVLEVVSANAHQTPRGEPLKVEGHEGGQFVFHLKKNEATDWKEALSINSPAAYQSFLVKYPEGQHTAEAKAAIKQLKAETLWQKITIAQDQALPELTSKLRLINQYVNQYEDQPHYDEALNVGELLEYKKAFFKAMNSEFALRRFLREPIPKVAGAVAIFEEADAVLKSKNRLVAAKQQEAAIKRLEEKARQKELADKAERNRQKQQENIVQQKEEKSLGTAEPVVKVLRKKLASFFQQDGKYLIPLLLCLPFLIWGTIVFIQGRGIFTDSRDGQTYKWVRLKDGKKWLAENLNFDSEGSWCYDNKNSNCKKYGRLYTWKAAKMACPKGWHLPSDEEWWKMASHYGKAYNTLKNNSGINAGEAAYKSLMTGGNTGFSAVFGGFRDSDGSFYRLGDSGHYWSSSGTREGSSGAWYYFFSRPSSYLSRDYDGKNWLFSCRCIQN